LANRSTYPCLIVLIVGRCPPAQLAELVQLITRQASVSVMLAHRLLSRSDHNAVDHPVFDPLPD
jgi:hypothetical protein